MNFIKLLEFMLLNTSFNCQEPIIETPKDAVKTFKKCGLDILVINDYIIRKNMIDFKNNIIDLDLFKRVLTVIKNEPILYLDIIDSFSNNQFKSKAHLLEKIDQLDILDSESEVVIFGCWYGSIIILHCQVR